MPRYVIERTFPQGLAIPASAEGALACRGVVENNASVGVTWVNSYVSQDKKKTFCVYDGPDADSVRRAAEKNQLPIDRVTPVTVLDPYFHH